MKKNRFKKLKLIIVCILTIMNLSSIAVYATDVAKPKENITMNVKYGIEGKYKNNYELPVNIEIENKGENVDGQVEVRVQTNAYDTYDAFICDVNINSNEKKTVTIPINLYENSSKISVLLKNGDNIIKEKTVIVGSGRIDEYNLFSGILTDDINGINLRTLNFNADGKRFGGDVRSVNVGLDIDMFSESYKAISALDMIIINNYDLSKFTDKHYKNLMEWVNNGGILVIGTGENSAKTIKDNGLGISYNGTKDLNGYTLADLEIKNATVALEKDGENLIYELDNEKGHIYVAAFDLANQNISNEDYIEYFWKEHIGKNFVNKVDRSNGNLNSNYSPYEITDLLNNIPIDKEINIGFIVGAFVFYCLIVGILVYFIMKKLGKRELLWAIIPVISILFSIMLFIIGTNTRIKDVALNQVSFIFKDGSQESTVKGYIGVALKNKGSLIVKEPDNVLLKILNEDNYYRNNSKSEFKKLGSKTVYKESNSYYEFENLSSLKMKKFTVSNYEQIVPSIDTNLKYESNILNGTIKNTLGNDIEKLLVVSSNSVWDVGKIKAGEEKNIDIKPTSSLGLSEYSHNLMGDYYNSYRDNKNKSNKENYKDIMRIQNEISSLVQIENNDLGPTYIIAITNMPVDYGFSFDNRSISKYDTTIVTQKVNIDFTDKDGILNYPMGYFKPVVLSSSAYIYADDSYNEINGQGDVTFKYQVGSDLDILNIAVGNLNRQYQASGNPKIFIYNNESQEYELLSIKSNGYDLTNPNAYIKDGIVKIQVTLEEDGYTQIPQISVKGRAK